MEFFVYVLFSEKLQKFYIGTTDQLEKRLVEHNQAHYPHAFTRKGIPWTLYWSVTLPDSHLGYRLEAFIKKMKSSDFLRKLKEDSSMIESIIEKLKAGEIGIPKLRERRT